MKKGILFKTLTTHMRIPGIFILVFSMISSLSYADMIKGSVVNEKGEGIAGATVVVKGSQKGAITDQHGKFSIDVAQKDVLVVSMISYISEEVTIWFVEDVKIRLREKIEARSLRTGYYRQEVSDISSAIFESDDEERNSTLAVDVLQILNGRVPGLFTNTPGRWEINPQVFIRGIASFRDNQPLLILDGLAIDADAVLGLNPEDIASIQVLKDAAASSIYGMRAMNGVILINSKKGTEEKLQLRYHGRAGIHTVKNPDHLISTPSDYSEIVWQAYENAGSAVNSANPYAYGRGKIPTYLYDESYQAYPAGREVNESLYTFPDHLIMRSNPEGTDWWNEIFRPALITNHHVGISTASKHADAFFSAAYFNQQGSMKHSSLERMSLRANSSFRIGRLELAENLSISGTDIIAPPQGSTPADNILTDISRAHAILPVHDISGVNFAGNKASGLGMGNNPVAHLYRNKDNNSTTWRLVGNLSAKLKLTEGLSVGSQIGINLSHGYQGSFSYPNYEIREPNTTYDWQENWSRGLDWTWTNLLLYQKNIGKNHKLNAMLGYEAVKSKNRFINGSMYDYLSNNQAAWYLNEDLAAPGSARVNSQGELHALLGSFGKLDYTFDEKYMLSLSLRRDASSQFGRENKGLFPAYSLGWRISEEPFLKKTDWIEDLKLRYSWGKTGSLANLSARLHDRFAGGTAYSYYDLTGSNNILTPGYAPFSMGNPALRWEESMGSNIGLDASLFKGHLNVSLDLFRQSSTHLLVNVRASGIWGTANRPWISAGQIENKGLDLMVNYQRNLSDYLGLDITFTASKYINSILQTDDSTASFYAAYSHTATGPTIINQPGQPVGAFFGYFYDGIFRNEEEVYEHASQTGARTGRVRFKDINEDGVIDENDQGVIGNPHPDMLMGLNLGLKIGQLDFSAFIFSSVGNDIFNFLNLYNVFRYGDANVRKEMLSRSFHPELNPDGDLPMLDDSDVYSRVSSSFYVEDGSFLRLQHARMAYTIPKVLLKRIRLKQLEIYLQAQNLKTFTRYSGPEPDILMRSDLGTLNMDYGTPPLPRIYLIGIEMGL